MKPRRRILALLAAMALIVLVPGCGPRSRGDGTAGTDGRPTTAPVEEAGTALDELEALLDQADDALDDSDEPADED